MRWNAQAKLQVSQRDDAAQRASGPARPVGWAAPAAGGADDLAEFCALLDAQAATLTHVAAALVGMGDAEDAAQEAVVRAWRAWPELRDRSAARSWLITITINVCRDWLRGRFGARRRLTDSLDGMANGLRLIAQLDADPGAADHAAALDVRHAIASLDEDLRVIVALRYYAGMDSTTIGAALGMPAATVRTKLRRALGQLRERLATPTDSHPTPDSEGRR